MFNDPFYRNHKQSILLECDIDNCDTFEEFQKRYSEAFLGADTRVGDYLGNLLYKYDKRDSYVSEQAGWSTGYVGNIVRGVVKNPGRDALISFCLVIGTTLEEVQTLLKYAGHAPLYVRRQRDVVIWYGFMKKKGRDAVNKDLAGLGFETLKEGR